VEFNYTDSSAKQHTATAFSWEKTDKAEALRADARLKS
jgi:S-adenosylmethionine synthetase